MFVTPALRREHLRIATTKSVYPLGLPARGRRLPEAHTARERKHKGGLANQKRLFQAKIELNGYFKGVLGNLSRRSRQCRTSRLLSLDTCSLYIQPVAPFTMILLQGNPLSVVIRIPRFIFFVLFILHSASSRRPTTGPVHCRQAPTVGSGWTGIESSHPCLWSLACPYLYLSLLRRPSRCFRFRGGGRSQSFSPSHSLQRN